MSALSVINPYTQLSTIYMGADTIDTFNIVETRSVFAPYDSDGLPVSLVIGATSNIILESAGDARMYLRDSSGFQMFQTKFEPDGSRTDKPMFDVRSNVLPGTGLSATVLNTGAGDNAIWVHGSDADMTTLIGTVQVRKFNGFTQFSTTESNGFLINNSTVFSSNATFSQEVQIESSLQVGGNMTLLGNFFTKNINVWKDSVELNQRVGFGFQINASNQLELVKYALFADSGETVTKKIATFGNTPLKLGEKLDQTSYLVFDELTGGIGMSGVASSNARSTPNLINSWKFTAAGNVSTTSAVALGKAEPQFPLDVAGVINADGIEAEIMTAQSMVTTSDERLKNIRGLVEPALCLHKIQMLNTIEYSYINQPERFKTGLRAQEVEKAMPDAVLVRPFANLEDCMLVDSSVMIGYLVGAVKELARQLESVNR